MSTPRQRLYLLLLAIGIIVPYRHAIGWLGEHGLDLPRFVDDMLANDIAAFFAWDVVIAVVVLLAAAVTDRALHVRDRVWVVIGSLAGAWDCRKNGVTPDQGDTPDEYCDPGIRSDGPGGGR
ncbi:DUF2834 domain-containing protein, partial [Streptosporangium roseum]|uniref:DUF2834 domain-containing protein n=1 Tax=Streptosporangium roseum TaxID=2001 RepID=UPI00068D39B4